MEEPQAESPEQTPLVEQNSAPQPEVTPQVMPPAPVRKRKTGWILALIVMIAAAAGAGGWWFAKKDSKKATDTPKTTQTTVIKNTNMPAKTATQSPYAVLSRDYNKEGTPIMVNPLDGSAAITAKGAEGGSVTDVYKNQVLARTPSTTTVATESLWLSQDSGKTFTQLFTGSAAASKDGSADQITSAKFSTDGKSVVFGLLQSKNINATTVSRKNTIKMIDPVTKATKDLFMSESAGVFITKFDATTEKVYFRTGCYDCDGGPTPTLYVYDIATVATTVLYDDKTLAASGILPNSTNTKLAILKASDKCSGLGGCAPYTLEEYDVASKASKVIYTQLSDSTPLLFGFQSDTDNLYYTKDTSVISITSDGTSLTLYTAPKTIVTLDYVSAERIVAAIGSYGDSKAVNKVVNYDVATKKSTDVLQVSSGVQETKVVWR